VLFMAKNRISLYVISCFLWLKHVLGSRAYHGCGSTLGLWIHAGTVDWLTTRNIVGLANVISRHLIQLNVISNKS
jgi:hypothetical protein